MTFKDLFYLGEGEDSKRSHSAWTSQPPVLLIPGKWVSVSSLRTDYDSPNLKEGKGDQEHQPSDSKGGLATSETGLTKVSRYTNLHRLPGGKNRTRGE